MTLWIDPTPVEIPASFADLRLPPLIAQTLVRRGIDTPDAARAFLRPDALPPTPFPGIEPAVDRIYTAIRNRETVCVWGDFDVDGQTSTTLLVQTLQALGGNVVYYIPIRGKESHGVHVESLKPLLDNGARLIVTCDTGITAHEAIDYANSRGVDVVITDHHELGAALPNAKAIVNPKMLPEGHALGTLAGVGVAYKLAEALFEQGEAEPARTRASPDSQVTTLHSLLDLVALGLIADVALLRGEARSLVQRGLQVLRNTARIGLRTMADLSGTSLDALTEESIGFSFAPRLNALGRLGDANPAVELLLSHNPARARVIATQIEGLNAQRRLLTTQVYEAALAQLRENPDLLSQPALVLVSQNWPGGVVGIVANKLVERYRKPTILLNEGPDGMLRGSARSIEGLNITEAITTQKDLLIGFGGHPMAAGLAMPADRLSQFRKGLGRSIEMQLGNVVREEPTLAIDAWLKLDEINLEFAEALEALAPFGAGNPALTFATHRLSLRSAATIGKNREHLRLNVEDEQGNVQSILWWGGAGSELPEEGSKFDIAYSLRASTFRGDKQVSLQFEEFRIVEEAPPELRKLKIDIVDYRTDVAGAFEKIREQTPGLQIWAEGADKARGKSRFELQFADELAIYSAPPSTSELHAVLETVRPKKLYLFGVAPAPEKADAFLARLAGYAKYSINQKSGKVTIQQLAVEMGQREGAIRLGLEWLAAGGHISIQRDDESVLLSAGNGDSNPYLKAELYLAIKGILEETAAYRAHFQRADAERLMESE
jgi:single-stranded-DNA-specific exonuclease